MNQPAQRPLPAIESDLRSCRATRLGAQAELAEVRRRQAELAEIEAVLVISIESRREQADRLLDERLSAVAGPADRLRASSSEGDRRYAAV